MAERRKLTLWAGFSQYSPKHLVLATGRDNTGASVAIQFAIFLLLYLTYSGRYGKLFQILFLDTHLVSLIALLIFWVEDGREGDSAWGTRLSRWLICCKRSWGIFLNTWKNSSDIACSFLTAQWSWILNTRLTSSEIFATAIMSASGKCQSPAILS